jgi:hypothetical protein
MNTILRIASNNGHPFSIKTQLNNKIKNKRQSIIPDHTHTQQQYTWVPFEYHSPLIRKITNIFKHTNMRVAIRSPNTLHNLLKTRKENANKYLTGGIYSL